MAIATISVNFATPGETYSGTATDKSVNPYSFKEALKIADYVNNYVRKNGDSLTGTLTFNIGAGGQAITAIGQNITCGAINASGALTLTSTVPSTSKTTGALTVLGGVGINGALYVGGDIVAFASSDERLKVNIRPIPSALDKVKQISGVLFDWNEISGKSGNDVGVIAQEIEKVVPEAVTTRDDGYKAVKYEKIIPLLIEAIKELAN